MGKDLIKYLESLSGEEEKRLLRRLKKGAAVYPLSHKDEQRLGIEPPDVVTIYSEDEQRAMDAHAAAIAKVSEARARWEAALADVERARTPWPAGSIMSRGLTNAEEADLERKIELAEQAKEIVEAAMLAEVAARPHRRRMPRHNAEPYPAYGKVVQ